MLTIISAAAATTSTHLGGKRDAVSNPKPKQNADFTLCVWQFTISPYISVYTNKKYVTDMT